MNQNRKQIRLYDLSRFKAFAGDDPETLREILVEFVRSGLKNAALFRQSVLEHDRNAVSELAHKMLPLFMQLQASGLVSLLGQLEPNDRTNPLPELYFLMAQMALEKMEEILKAIQEKENIGLN